MIRCRRARNSQGFSVIRISFAATGFASTHLKESPPVGARSLRFPTISLFWYDKMLPPWAAPTLYTFDVTSVCDGTTDAFGQMATIPVLPFWTDELRSHDGGRDAASSV